MMKTSITTNTLNPYPEIVKSRRTFTFNTNINDKTDLSIISGGFERRTSSFKLKRNSVPFYVIHIPVSGKSYITIDDCNYTIKKGCIVAYGPNQSHNYIDDEKSPLTHYYFQFIGKEVPSLFEIAGLKSSHCIELENPERARQLANLILDNAFAKNSHSVELCNCYLRALLLEQSHAKTFSEKKRSLAKATYIECRNFIDFNFSNILSLDDVASALNISTNYVSVLFSKYNNTTPYEYINNLKMNKASELLLTTSMKVRAIAKEVGFKDQYHFSRNFKKFHGKSPVNYAKKYKGL